MESFDQKIERTVNLIKQAKNTVILTGAGISTPSNIPDFRTAGSGLWTKYDPMQVASLSSFQRNPADFFDWLRPLILVILSAKPNTAHIAIAKMGKVGIFKSVITQNIDLLHRQAQTENLIEIHGSLSHFNCFRCGRTYSSQSLIIQEYIINGSIPHCDQCNGFLKPSITLFEEMMPELAWKQAYTNCENADLVIAVGTSLEVYPANILPQIALDQNAKLIINTISNTDLDDRADVLLHDDVIAVWEKILNYFPDL